MAWSPQRDRLDDLVVPLEKGIVLMLDLCSGFGGASAAMAEHGWRVVKLDIEPRVHPHIVGDLRSLPLRPFPVDLLWVSVPCTDYSRNDLPWFRDEPPPDLALWKAAEQVIAEWQPSWWVMENVRGAQRWHGKATVHFGSRFLWSNLPAFVQPVWKFRGKHNLCSGTDPLRNAKRGYIPYPISEAVALSVEAMGIGAPAWGGRIGWDVK